MAQDIFAPKTSFDIGYERPQQGVVDQTGKIVADFQAMALGAEARAVQGQASLERSQAAGLSAAMDIAGTAYDMYDTAREKRAVSDMLGAIDNVDAQADEKGMSFEARRARYSAAVQEAASKLPGGFADLAKYNSTLKAKTGLDFGDITKSTEAMQFDVMQKNPVFQTAYLASQVTQPNLTPQQRVEFAQGQAASTAAVELLQTTANREDLDQYYTKIKPAVQTRIQNLDAAVIASIQLKRDSGQPITTTDVEALEVRVAEAKRLIDLAVPNSVPDSERSEYAEYFTNLDGFLTQLKESKDPDKIATGVASYLAQTGNTMGDVLAGAKITDTNILSTPQGLEIFKNVTTKLSDGSATAAVSTSGDLGSIFDSLVEARQGDVVGPNTIMSQEELDVVFSTKGLTAQDMMTERETGLGLIKSLDVANLATDKGQRQMVAGIASVVKSLNNLDLQQTGSKLQELVVGSGLIDKINMLDSYDKATANQIRTLLNSAISNNLRFSEAKIQSIEANGRGYTNRNPGLVWDEAEQVYYATNPDYIRSVKEGFRFQPGLLSANISGDRLRLPKGSELAYGDIERAYKHREVVSVANGILGQTMVEEADTVMTDVGGVPAPQRMEVLDFIKAGEGNYDSSNRGTIGNKIIGTQLSGTTRGGKPLTEMTIGEIKSYQKIKDPNNPNRLFAVGAYQITPDTMDAAMKAAGVTDSTIFSPAVQDRMGLGLMIGSKRPKLAAYIKGESDDIDAAMLEFAKEWASVPDPRTGRSYHGKGNKAKHTVEETRQALMNAREAYSSGIISEELPPLRDQATQDIIDTASQAIEASNQFGNVMPRPTDNENRAAAWDALYGGTHDPETGQIIQGN